MPGSLNSNQVKRYHESGYLCPLDLLDLMQLQAALCELDAAEAQHRLLNLDKSLTEYA